jgi:hypothetical protein
MGIKISNSQRIVKPKKESGSSEWYFYKECKNGHYVKVRSKFKTYFDDHCPVCGEEYVRNQRGGGLNVKEKGDKRPFEKASS